MKTTTSARIGLAAALIGTAAALATTVAPATAQPTPAPAPATTNALAQQVKEPVPNTSGVRLDIYNSQADSIFVQYYRNNAEKWGEPYEVKPGGHTWHDGNKTGWDDVEIRVYARWYDADNEQNYIEVDAENPPVGYPWLSVDWDRESFDTWDRKQWSTDEFGDIKHHASWDAYRGDDKPGRKHFILTVNP